jgi:hypothetical protein
VLASDGTHLANGTGDSYAHPVLMTLDNLNSAVRRNSSNHAFTMIALLPKVHFEVADKKLARALSDRIYHECLRNLMLPLRKIARSGKEMTDSLGQVRMCYTVLAAYMADLPEATRLAGVINNTSPVTMAAGEHLGDPFRHEPRLIAITSRSIEKAKELHHPERDIKQFINAVRKERLTGVHKLIWSSWPNSEPSVALCFDLLHSGHKFWNDHIFEWTINAVGADEMDFRFKALHPRQGFRYFQKGVTQLTKTGGRDHRDMQRFILCVADGAVPFQFLKLIRVQLDYFYIAQYSEVTQPDLQLILDLLGKFHELKPIVHANGYREVEGWAIPKLELQQNIVPSIIAHGTLLGLSTDLSEHEHIENVKNTYAFTNKKDYQHQMVRSLTRLEQMRHFDKATAMVSAGDSADRMDPMNFADDLDEEGENRWLDGLGTVQNLRGGKRKGHMDYFAVVKALEDPNVDQRQKVRVRTFVSSPYTAIHLNRDPAISTISIHAAMEMYQLPDLLEACQEYYYLRSRPIDRTRPVIDRYFRSLPEDVDPIQFDFIHIWFNVRVQNKSLMTPGLVNESVSIHAKPPSQQNPSVQRPTTRQLDWRYGRYDCALFVNDPQKLFTGKANLQGTVRFPLMNLLRMN